MVVLSACELGRASVRSGDEVAHDVLVRLHRGLGAGEQPAVALAAALASEASPRGAAGAGEGAPAPFVCFA